jgi:CBS domain-containing protein
MAAIPRILLSPRQPHPDRPTAPDSGENPMLAHAVMTASPLSVGIGTTVSEIIHIMLRRNISAVMVTANDGSLAGVVSEGDLIRRKGGGHQQRLNHWLDRLAEGGPMNLEFLHSLQLGEMTAASVMTSPVITRDERTSLAEIAEVMLKYGIKRVPITREGKIVGLVGRRDILRTLVEQEARPD